MRAVILAGGQGTRLRPYTTVIPKPLVPVGDRPILQHIIDRLSACGVREIDLCVSYLGELIEAYFSQSGRIPDGTTLRWHREPELLGTAGALRIVPDLDETFISMNGDILTTLDYSLLVDHHRSTGAALTIAMHRKEVKLDLGVIESKNGRVCGYREKPTLDYDVSMGIYVYEPRALCHLPPGPCQFPELVLRLIDAGEKVCAMRSDARWYDIGTPIEYERAIADIELLALRSGTDGSASPEQIVQRPERL